jgi:hypothetical protein
MRADHDDVAASPKRDSARTLLVVAIPRKVSVLSRRMRPGVAASCSPTSWVTEVTGMSRPKSLPSVPLSVPGWLL